MKISTSFHFCQLAAASINLISLYSLPLLVAFNFFSLSSPFYSALHSLSLGLERGRVDQYLCEDGL